MTIVLTRSELGKIDSFTYKNFTYKNIRLYADMYDLKFDSVSVYLEQDGVHAELNGMLNFNPETVSTDYDESDKLYFDEISLERILDIVELEKPDGVIIAMGGQVANNLAIDLEKNNIKILGTPAKYIDKAEDRNKFSALLDKIEVDQPLWQEVVSHKDALRFANKVGYPVLIRPSYVLSGAAMRVCTDDDMLSNFLEKAAEVSKKHPVVISKFEDNAKEIEIDAVADKGKLKIYALSEHIENAGTHSGDATIVFPPQKLYLETIRKIKVWVNP